MPGRIVLRAVDRKVGQRSFDDKAPGVGRNNATVQEPWLDRKLPVGVLAQTLLEGGVAWGVMEEGIPWSLQIETRDWWHACCRGGVLQLCAATPSAGVAWCNEPGKSCVDCLLSRAVISLLFLATTKKLVCQMIWLVWVPQKRFAACISFAFWYACSISSFGKQDFRDMPQVILARTSLQSFINGFDG